MHPLFFVGIALTVVGLIASSGKKKPADNTPQEGGVGPDHTEQPLVECGAAEVVDEDIPDSAEKKRTLLDMLPANRSPESEDLDPEDVKRLYAERPQAVLDPVANIAMEVSRSCEQKGENDKAEAWWRYSLHLRRPPKGGSGNTGG